MNVDVSQLESLNCLFVRVMGEIFLSPNQNATFNDLTGAQRKILYYLGIHGPTKMSDVARQVAVSVNGATGIVDRLVRMGLVERDRDETDRRVILVRLTPAGQEAHRELMSIHQHKLKEVLSGLPPEKRQELIASFERIYVLLSELREPGPGKPCKPPSD